MPPMVKNPLANAGDVKHGFSPWVRKIPWRGTWQPTPAFLPGESHGQRRLQSIESQRVRHTYPKYIRVRMGIQWNIINTMEYYSAIKRIK